MSGLNKYFWFLKYINHCKFSWTFSRLTPAIFQFVSTLLNALTFKYLFLCFESRSFDYLKLALFLSVLGFFIHSISGAIIEYLRVKSTSIIKSELKKDLLQKVLNLPILTLQKEHSGNMIARFNQDIDVAVDAIDSVVVKTILPIFLGVSYLFVVYFTIWQLGVFYSLVAIPIAVFGKLFSRPFRKSGQTVQQKLGLFNENFANALAGLSTIKQFSLEDTMKNKSIDAADQIFSARKEQIHLRLKYSIVVNIFSHIFSTFPIILGCVLVALKEAALPDVMFVSRYTYQIRGIVSGLINVTSDLQFQLAAVERLKEVFDYESENFGIENTGSLEKEISLHIKNLCAAYEGESVLSNIEFSAKAGEIIALVGSSGSGKSTLLKSIMQFVPYEGTIEISDKSIKDLHINQLRNAVAYVSQDYELFDGTIYENISFGKQNATQEEIIESAKKSFCHDFIMALPNQYETQVGENGLNLSGGQRQRICIARAILKNAPILIFDEATSALDYETEWQIINSLASQQKDRIIIICTHRLSTIQIASKIYVLNQGEIIQQGTHEKLINESGIYRQFYNLQVAL